MAKKKSWFNFVKKFFSLDSKSKAEKKEKKWKWVFGRLRKTERLASLAAPSPPKETSKSKVRRDDEDHEQSKHGINNTVDVICLSETPQSTDPPHSGNETETAQESAATRIQTAFRAYLARKALGALKGIVRLQAIIRGSAVRRQAVTTLKCLQSIVIIQSQVSARGVLLYSDKNSNCLQSYKDSMMDLNCHRRWDDSLLSKKEAEAFNLSKKQAMNKRDRIKEYSFHTRRSAESERNQVSGRWRYWLDQWVDTQLSKSKEYEDLDSVFPSNSKKKKEYGGKRPLKTGQGQVEGPELTPISIVPRRLSHHRKQVSFGDSSNQFLDSSPVLLPTYMATTESVKAKARPISSPKLRGRNCDSYSEGYSPCKNNNVSLVSSIFSSEFPSSVKFGRSAGSQQRSPSLKSSSGIVKLGRSLN